MKNLMKILGLLMLLSVTGHSQTSHFYQESFDSNDETGWSFLAFGADISTQDGMLNVTSVEDATIHVFPPIGATMNDFSLRVKGGGEVGGGIGRQGFNSYLGLHMEYDSIYVIYAEQVEYYPEPNFVWSIGYPIPGNTNSMQLDAIKSGNNLLIKAYMNDQLFYDGQITNVYEGLLYGRMVLYTLAGETNNSFTLDEIDINYNPYPTESETYTDDFNFQQAPWMKFGDLEQTPQSITLVNSSLNFNYNGDNESALYVIPPIPSVGNFSIEVEGESGPDHNASFGISRFFDYKTYTTMFIEDDSLYIGYAIDAFEPTMIGSAPINPATTTKLKFSVEGIAPNLVLKGWANDVLLITGNLSNASNRLSYGQLAVGFDRGNVMNSSFDKVTINYNPFQQPTSIFEKDPDNSPVIVYPNPFANAASISYKITKPGMVSLIIYDTFGRRISTLVNSWQQSDSYEIHFDAAGLSSGIYYYHLESAADHHSGKIHILK